jgi:prepilin-type N-terminal cleavage/methylation domain-containing protein
MQVSHQTQKTLGFTLIEMIVSLALFSVVVTVAVGALLMLIGANDQLQGEQSVMTNLSFALDSMTREIRTGTNYYCVSSNIESGFFVNGTSLEPPTLAADATQACSGGNTSDNNYHGIIFTEAGDSITGQTSGSDRRIMYFLDRDAGQIFRRVGNEDRQSIVASGIVIQDADFFVSSPGPLTPGGDTIQPAVTIHIEALDANGASASEKVFFIQSTVTQRTLDL